MARSDQYGHEKNSRRDAGKRALAQDPVGNRASVGPRDMTVRAKDILRLLEIENCSSEQEIYRHSFSVGHLVHSMGLPKAHELLGLDYQQASTDQANQEKTIELDAKLWGLNSQELEKHSPHYLLLRQLDDPTKAESLREEMLNNGGRGEFEIELTASERSQILSKLNKNTKERV
jgi:hypothetical protein